MADTVDDVTVDDFSSARPVARKARVSGLSANALAALALADPTAADLLRKSLRKP